MIARDKLLTFRAEIPDAVSIDIDEERVFDQEQVPVYETSGSLPGQDVDVTVYNIYRTNGEDLDDQYHSVEYIFPEAGGDFYDEIAEFQEEATMNWYGERLIPAVNEYGGEVRMSVPIPNSLVHDSADEKVMATRMADEVLDVLNDFLGNEEKPRYVLPDSGIVFQP